MFDRMTWNAESTVFRLKRFHLLEDETDPCWLYEAAGGQMLDSRTTASFSDDDELR